jgi:hypothetical protein
MHNILKSALMAVVFLVTSPVWGSGDEWQISPKPAETSLYQASLTPTVDGSPIAPVSVRNLTPDLDRPRTQGILASTTWLKGAFSTETEVAANQGVSAGDDPSTRMMRLGVTGSTGLARYGITYRKAGQAFYQGSDQDLREAWGEWKNGAMALRSTVGQQWNNVDDPARARVEQSYNRLGLSWNRSGWPQFALTYAENAVNSTLNPVGVAPQNANSHTVEAAFGYSGAAWDARLASSYGLETDLLRYGESHVQTQTVTASLRPGNTLTITPTFGYRAAQQEWSGARIDSPSAALTMNYQQSRGLRISATGNYSGTRSSDRLIDLDTIGGKGILAWEFEPLRDWKPLLSLEGGYNVQVNRLMPSAQTEDLSGLLRLVLATL